MTSTCQDVYKNPAQVCYNHANSCLGRMDQLPTRNARGRDSGPPRRARRPWNKDLNRRAPRKVGRVSHPWVLTRRESVPRDIAANGVAAQPLTNLFRPFRTSSTLLVRHFMIAPLQFPTHRIQQQYRIDLSLGCSEELRAAIRKLTNDLLVSRLGIHPGCSNSTAGRNPP